MTMILQHGSTEKPSILESLSGSIVVVSFEDHKNIKLSYL